MERRSEVIEFVEVIPERLAVRPASWERMREAKIVAVDIETSNKDHGHPMGQAIKEWGLSFLADITFIGVAFSDQADDGVVIQLPMSEDEYAFMTELFTREDVLLLFHNGRFDLRGLCGRLNLPFPTNTFDTYTAALIMGVTQIQEASLSSQCKAYQEVIIGDVTYTVDDFEDQDNGKTFTDQWTNWHLYLKIKKDRDVLDSLPPELVVWYVLEDSRLTWKLYDAQREWMDILAKDYGYIALEELMLIEQRYTWVANGWSVNGYHIDRDYITIKLEELADKRWEIELALAEMGVGTLTSYDSRVRYFFDICGVPRPDNDDPEQEFLFTQTGLFAFNDAALKYYEQAFPAETAWYTYYQHMLKMETTLIGYLAHSDLDGKGHSTIGTGTLTTRSSGTNPNNMNVSLDLPEEVEALGWETISARGCIIASPGNNLFELDYEAAEKRAQSLAAQEERLARIFVEGRDLHTENAKIFFKHKWAHAEAKLAAAATDEEADHWKAVLKTLRTQGKPLTFGLDYGMGARKASRQMRISLEEAQDMISNFESHFYKLAQWKRAVQAEAEQNYNHMKECPNPLFAHGFVTNMFGQRVLIDDPYWDESEQSLRTYWYKAANYIPQSMVAWIIKKATWEIYWYLEGTNTRMIQQVHDALIFDGDPREIDELALGITRIMQKAVPYELSLVGDLYVDWPVSLNHADNAVKWGWRYGHEYPLATHDSKGKPREIMYSPELVKQELEDNYRYNKLGAIEGEQAYLQQSIEAGPGSQMYLYVPQNGGVEARQWCDMPHDLDELRRIAHVLVAWKRQQAIPQEWAAVCDEYVRFVDWALAKHANLEYQLRKYQEWIEANDHQVVA